MTIGKYFKFILHDPVRSHRESTCIRLKIGIYIYLIISNMRSIFFYLKTIIISICTDTRVYISAETHTHIEIYTGVHNYCFYPIFFIIKIYIIIILKAHLICNLGKITYNLFLYCLLNEENICFLDNTNRFYFF